MRLLVLTMLVWSSPISAQQLAGPAATAEPRLALQQFEMPVIDYRAPDGSWKRGSGIIVGRDVAPNTTVGLGFFRMRPKSVEGSEAPFAGRSKKVAVGVRLRF